MRHTKIICTLGPKTESEDMLKKLVEAGMNIVRINMSHGEHHWHSLVMDRVRKISRNLQFPVGIMLDTQGPEIRTSANTEMGLKEGEIFKIYVGSAADFDEREKHTVINYDNLAKKVKKGSAILIDNGLIALEVLEVYDNVVTCRVLNGGNLGKRKSVSIPGIKTDLPAMTSKDEKDIKLGVEHRIDYVAQSFVRRKEDVKKMREFLKSCGSNAMIIAKIEDQEGVDNIDEIIAESDGIMVARGDLGVQIPFEEIPIVQMQIVRKCISVGKPVIIATQLLESMLTNPRPTRAEVTDIATAVIEKADCIMLSGETTKGDYPIECVLTMDKVARSVQRKLKFSTSSSIKTTDVKESITLGACINAQNLDAKAIIAFSKTGRLLSLVTKNRPNIDIFVFTDNEEVRRKMIIHHGAFPFKIKFRNFDIMMRDAVKILKKNKLICSGDRVVTVSDITPHKNVDVMEIREID